MTWEKFDAQLFWDLPFEIQEMIVQCLPPSCHFRGLFSKQLHDTSCVVAGLERSIIPCIYYDHVDCAQYVYENYCQVDMTVSYLKISNEMQTFLNKNNIRLIRDRMHPYMRQHIDEKQKQTNKSNKPSNSVESTSTSTWRVYQAFDLEEITWWLTRRGKTAQRSTPPPQIRKQILLGPLKLSYWGCTEQQLCWWHPRRAPCIMLVGQQ